MNPFGTLDRLSGFGGPSVQDLLARLTGGLGGDSTSALGGAANRSPSAADALLPFRGSEVSDRRSGSGSGEGVLVDISDIARSLLANASRAEASSSSFELRLDLSQLGARVDGRGQRIEVEGERLQVDLKIEAQRGTVEKDGRTLEFESLEISFSIQQTSVRASSGFAASPDDRENSSDDLQGTGAGQEKPGRALLDGLREFASQLAKALEGTEPDRQVLRLSDLEKQLRKLGKRLDATLQSIGHALEALGRHNSSPSAPGSASPEPTSPQTLPSAPVQAANQFVAYKESLSVQIESLTLTRRGSGSAAPPPSPDAVAAAPSAAETPTRGGVSA